MISYAANTKSRIHPTAVIEEGAKLADDVVIGPFCVIGSQVSIGAGTRVNSHVVVTGNTRIGCNNHFFQFSSIGEDCQDLKYCGEKTWLEIGDNNVVREGCTIHRGTSQGGGVTTILNNNLFMANVHIAHDCFVGNECILVNNVGLGGHVYLGDGAILGGNTGVHQYCHIGSFSMSAGQSAVFKDIPAFTMVRGNPAAARGMNVEGMRRRGYTLEVINTLKQCYKVVYRNGWVLEKAIEYLEAMESPFYQVQLFIDSLKSSKRGITR